MNLSVIARTGVFAAVIGVSGATLHAASLQIQFSGLNFTYSGGPDAGRLYDSPNAAGGTGSPAVSDALIAMVFLLDGTQVGPTLTSQIYADFLFTGVNNIPATGTVTPVTSTGNMGAFGFDLLMPDGAGGSTWGLDLEVNAVTVMYDPGTMQFTIEGSADAASLSQQNLPSFLSGIAFDPNEQIAISFSGSAHTDDVSTSGGFVTGWTAAGTGEIIGSTVIPEPQEYLMAALGLLGLGFVVYRRKLRAL